jgi:glucose-1-phosphate adenylyltransferase
MALVLSGGGGERLSVLTAERAVSAVPFGGKYRVIDFALSNLCHSGAEHVGLLTQHAPISLHDHIGSGRPWDLDRRQGGVVVLQPYLTRSHAGFYRGTADAIVQNWSEVEDRAPARVLVLSGDHVYRMDYRSMLGAHLELRAAVTLAVAQVPADEARRFGMVTFDRDRRVRSLVEKPERADTPWAFMGVYLFDTTVLGSYLSGRPVNLVLDVLRPMLDAGERVIAHPFEGYWEDVGTVGAFYRANLELVAPAPRLALHDQRWPILTRDEERPPVHFRDHARVEESLIANGCRIDGVVRRSVLFSGVHVERGAEIVESVVMPDVHVGAGARIERSIVDKYARIGTGARVGDGTPSVSPDSAWLEGLTLIGKDAVVPAGARVGRSVVVGIGAREPDFEPGVVPAGAVIPSRAWYEDLP